MKNKLYIFIIFLFVFSLTGCSNNYNNYNNKEETNLNKQETMEIETSKNKKETIKLENIIDLEQSSNMIEESSKKEFLITETKTNINIESTIEKKQKELNLVSNFINPKDYNLKEIGNSQNFKDFKNYISKDLDKNCGIYIKDNYISYNGTTEGPSIEMYINEEYYAIFLYCVLDKNIEKDQYIIQKNNEVLKSLLNTISPEANLLYEKIYEDYEINSNIPEDSYICIGNNQIKSELMQKCVIYYIKNR